MMSAQKEVKPILYPESDGKPMADNTLQARYIVSIYDALSGIFRDDPNVFVAAKFGAPWRARFWCFTPLKASASCPTANCGSS